MLELPYKTNIPQAYMILQGVRITAMRSAERSASSPLPLGCRESEQFHSHPSPNALLSHLGAKPMCLERKAVALAFSKLTACHPVPCGTRPTERQYISFGANLSLLCKGTVHIHSFIHSLQRLFIDSLLLAKHVLSVGPGN